jgi:deoxyribonuclease IV
VIEAFINTVSGSGIGPVVDHMPYLPNLASEKEELHAHSVATLTDELHRCELLKIPFLVTHLGHNPEGKRGRNQVISAITSALDSIPGSCRILLENTAGEKNGVGSQIADIAAVFEGIDNEERTGICFDTCHAFAAGYDLRTETGVSDTIQIIDDAIGLEHLYLIHLNDSTGDLGSGRDRHYHIGLGKIGMQGMYHILHHPAIIRLPLVCETPVNDERDDAGNIRVVREIAALQQIPKNEQQTLL